MVTSSTEPEWDEETRDLHIAYDQLQARTGPNGEYLPEATAPGAASDDYTSGFGYVPKGPFTNWHEKTRLDAIDQFRAAQGDKANLNGVYFTAEMVTYETPPTS